MRNLVKGRYISQTLIGLLLSIIPAVSLAADQDITEIMLRLRELVRPFTILIQSITYVAGVYMIARGLMLLKAFAMPLTQATRPGEIGGPLAYVIIGSLMIASLDTMNVLSRTFFGDRYFNVMYISSPEASDQIVESLLGYTGGDTTEDKWQQIWLTLVIYIQFIGYLAFVRGLFIMSHSGQPGVQPGSISKGIIHLVGGVLAVNFVPFVTAIQNTFLR